MPKTRKQSLKNKTIKNKHKLNKQKNKNKQNKTKKQVISFAQKQKAIKQLKHAIKKHILNIIKTHQRQHQLHGGWGPRMGVKGPDGKVISETKRLEQIGSSIYESIVSFFRELYEWITGKTDEREYKNGLKSSKEILKGVASIKAENIRKRNTNTSLPSNVQAIVNTAVVKLQSAARGHSARKTVKEKRRERDDEADAATLVDKSRRELNKKVENLKSVLSENDMTKVVNAEYGNLGGPVVHQG
jgi:hypothetical protein